MKNAIFIHCGNMDTDKYGRENTNRCQNIINEIGEYIENSKIINDVEFINIEVVGNPHIELKLPKVKINFNGNDVHQWEFPTLNRIIEFAKYNIDYNILYLHTKGSSMSIKDSNAKYHDDVRNYHLYWLLTNYKICMNFLKNYDVVGVELQHIPTLHYSHNMWWAKSSHINKLKHPLEYPLIYDERHNAEFWIGREPTSLYHSVFNLYNVHTDAISYEKKLYR